MCPGLFIEAVNKEDIVAMRPRGCYTNKSTHSVDLNVCNLTPLSLFPLLPLKKIGHSGSVQRHIHRLGIGVDFLFGSFCLFAFIWLFLCLSIANHKNHS